ncbi:MAG TPA: SDR family oxidoreductase [Roseiflexaceae bacterium]|nr:SDR family oxidoreductase [Roseiflexaceae bacterium]
MTNQPGQEYATAVAIIGMSGRFPGARSVEQFWANISQGVCAIRRFSDEELVAAGVSPEQLRQPNYVKAGTVVEDVDLFDAAFFGYPPRETEVLDPQHRLFLECSWEALEQAAYNPETFKGLIGVFAGTAYPTYLSNNISTHPKLLDEVGLIQIGLGNERDSLTSTVSYKLNLRGPSVSVQTFCSTSLVAVHFACQSLITYECDMVLAGGVAIGIPQVSGYVYQEGGIVSPDGSCRTFDASAQGSVMGNGLGVVVLKRLQEAIDDGDQIYAVIRGSATNNDGQRKVGYTAPGLGGQTSVILRGLSNAGLKADSIGYIEAHGTATPLGDSVELSAMLRAFQRGTKRKQFCAIGSVKPNIGHLDRAAGVAGLIKATLALHHRQLPPHLNFEQPSPDIDLAASPFFVNTELRDWPSGSEPRRAGVNSFGLGGTNAHVVLEEAPARPPSGPGHPWQLLVLSAKTEAALEAMTDRLAAHCRANPGLNPADLAYTLQVGRAAFNHRRALVFRDPADAAEALERRDRARVLTRNQTRRDQAVALLVPGLDDPLDGLGRELYRHEPAFRATFDHCAAVLRPLLRHDIRLFLEPDAPEGQPDPLALHVALCYALARLLAGWGLAPQAILGHGAGEYVAACLSGVLSLEDALRLVAARSALLRDLPAGAALAVELGEHAVEPYLSDSVALAAVNSPRSCVLAGTPDGIAAARARLQQEGVGHRLLPAGHALHTLLVEDVAPALTDLARSLTLQPPQVPSISNLTGTWITAEQATDPAYWARQLCQPLRFADGVQTLLQSKALLVELGREPRLGEHVRLHPACLPEQHDRIFPALAPLGADSSELAGLLHTLGQLWQAGASIDWKALHGQAPRYRLPLPTYPFERRRFWIEPARPTPAAAPAEPASAKRPDPADWFYQPVWEPAAPPDGEMPAGTWLVFADRGGLGAAVAEQVRAAGQAVALVQAGDAFAEQADGVFVLRPDAPDDYHALLHRLERGPGLPTAVLHLWSLDRPDAPPGVARFQQAQRQGYYSLLALTQALAQSQSAPIQITVATGGAQPALPEELPDADFATLGGLCLVLNQEHPNLRCRLVDLGPDDRPAGLAEALLREAQARDPELLAAYRAGVRLAQRYRPLRLEGGPSPIRPGGVYLITGGQGEVGSVLAEHLARNAQARLALLARSPLPPRDVWEGWLAERPADDPTAGRIRQVQQLEALGAQVLVLQADVADPEQLAAALSQAEAAFGPLNGLIHAAGISDPSTYAVTQNLSREQCETHFRPKAYGLYALEQVLGGRALDFCLVFSSLSAVLGGLGFGAYAAANSFCDAFVQSRSGTLPWRAVNWDTWQRRVNLHGPVGGTVAQYEMLPEQGVQAFERVLAASSQRRLVNSTGDLQARIRQWVRLEQLADSDADGPPGGAGVSAGDYEQRIARIWRQVLGIEQVGLHDNFFDLGGNSLNGLQVTAKINKEFGVQIPAVALFEAPTVGALAQYLRPQGASETEAEEARLQGRRAGARQTGGAQDIAIISMAGRFPGARTVEQLWQNLCDGIESVAHFDDAELLAAGVDPLLIQHPSYVKARPVLDDVSHFDAAFFGYTPREAALMDPQQRLFHECAWEAVELAGYDTQRYPGLVGVFGGANLNLYMFNMVTDPELITAINDTTILENDKDALATNVAYKLNLRGPSFAVQTFCSTSLVAVHLACRSLLGGECDMALAGGVSVRVPVRAGYLFQQGDQVSPDGHCRTFDAQGEGAIFGDGVAVVMLKRLADALEDGDTVHAVIKGSAINNDGALKVGYTAPSVVGQSEVIVTAIERAGVDPTTIGYVEAHGTATKLGDPIEVAALTKAYRTFTDRRQFCAIASLKPNVGHLDRAAGATGLIKTVMMLKHGLIPPLLHFREPNPEIDFESSPFFVPTALRQWPRLGERRRAAVNSLGVGGTNAHVIVEEPPPQASGGPSRPYQLLVLSAHTPTALDAAARNLHDLLQARPDLDLADVAYTLLVGRRVFEHRRALVCRDHEEACRLLRGEAPPRVFNAVQRPLQRPVAMLFAGVGDHYAGMARELYEGEPLFRSTVDRCARILQTYLNQDIRTLLFPAQAAAPASDGGPNLRAMLGREGGPAEPPSPLHQTLIAQPAVFVIDYALAQLFMSWGVLPQALIGYSLGEYVAACVSGVLSLDDALRLVATRARLIQDLPGGAMLAVALSEAEIAPYLGDGVALAAVNSPSACVLAGPPAAVAALTERLRGEGVACRPVETTHAFHTATLGPAAGPLTELARSLKLQPPRIPYLSNVTGTWITAEQATDPAYWAEHMCRPVRFAEGVAALLAQPDTLLLEIGPGQALGSFVRQHPDCPRERMGMVLASLRARHDRQGDLQTLLATLGRLWLLDVPVRWSSVYADERRRRVPLPTYPFERQHFWLSPRRGRGSAAFGSPERRTDMSSWFAAASWKRISPCEQVQVRRRLGTPQTWLILTDAGGLGAALGRWLIANGQTVVSVTPGDQYARIGPQDYTVRPERRADYEQLLNNLAEAQQLPAQVVHLWCVAPAPPDADTDPDAAARVMAHGFGSLLALTQALGELDLERCMIQVVSTELHEVSGTETLSAAKATLIGPCKIIPQEYAALASRSIDLVLPPGDSPPDALVERLALELLSPDEEPVVALRGSHRWSQTFEAAPISPPPASPLRQGGVYLLTGGLGGLGLAMAEHLAEHVQARLVLLGRSGLPPREQWDSILAGHDPESGIARRIAAVRRLEARTPVLVIQADVADAGQVRAAVAQTLEHFGALHTVLHTAGVPANGLMQRKTPEAAAAVFAPKVQGTMALAQALRGVALDALVLFSSVTSATGGGPGQADYCAANAFLDAFAHKHHHDYGTVVSISWGEWLWDAWQAGLQGFPEEVRAILIATRRAYGISFAEGAEALTRILSRGLPHVFVTPQDLVGMVETSRRSSAAEILKQVKAQRQTRPLYPRPTLGTSYVAPGSDLEGSIATLWGDVLGIEQIGIHDNFFELGGNSLLGIDLIARMRKELRLDKLQTYVLYEAPSVAAMAEYIVQLQTEAQETAAVQALEDRAEKRREHLKQFRRRG